MTNKATKQTDKAVKGRWLNEIDRPLNITSGNPKRLKLRTITVHGGFKYYWHDILEDCRDL